MTDYVKGQNFTALRATDADPAIFDTEFTSVATSSSTKMDKTGGVFSGQVTGQAGAAASNLLIASDVKLWSFTAGTKMLFYQAAAPTGWTQDTTATINDAMIRLVTGSGGGTGGTELISSGVTVDNHTLTINEIPDHIHFLEYTFIASKTGANGASYTAVVFPINIGQGVNGNTGFQNGGTPGGPHNHTLNGSATWTPKYIDAIVCTKN